ncbi:hypothetical protein [Candidatus Enterococcus ferrettii]|uniref:Uncharacterized protein n=1 Tax=Candidatus Enterococcus ferrettii TaxID=2815324 RepID=A0ABV0EUC3_9ENTE|nr:hypothetical protein [Enterococcus sp. 665A]MBO1339454.1 hypothetical protein [Enterococcus sp. 665A]
MELGSLAEWVTGLAELLAVCVALFLPIFMDRNKRKRASKKLIVVTSNMALRVIQEKEENEGKRVEKLDSYKDFKEFQSVVSIIVDDPVTLSRITAANELLLSIHRDNSNLATISSSINVSKGS